MKVSELSQESKQCILHSYHCTGEYKRLARNIQKLLSRGQNKRAQEDMEYLKRREQLFLEEFCAELSDNHMSMKEVSKEMETEDFLELSHKCYTIVLLSDVIDSCIRDVKRVAKKYEENFQLDCYQNLYNMGEKLKAQLDKIYDSQSPKVASLYADTMDSIENYMFKRIDTLTKRMAKLDEQYKRQVEREHLREAKAASKKSV